MRTLFLPSMNATRKHEGMMYVCMYGWKFKARQTQNKRKKQIDVSEKNQTGIGKHEKDVMGGRIGVGCNTTATSLPSIIG